MKKREGEEIEECKKEEESQQGGQKDAGVESTGNDNESKKTYKRCVQVGELWVFRKKRKGGREIVTEREIGEGVQVLHCALISNR